MARIRLNGKHRNKFALVDDEDVELLCAHKWYLGSHGYATTTYHRKGRGKADPDRNVNLSMHRLLMGEPEGTVDHINGDRLDNRRKNLRVVSMTVNNRNQRLRAAGQYPFNVVPSSNGSGFDVRINADYYGNYPTPKLAGQVADVIRRARGYGVLNYPDEPLSDDVVIVNWNREPRRAQYRSSEKGISWFSPREKWRFIWNKKTLGYFGTEEEAIEFKRKYLATSHENQVSQSPVVIVPSRRLRLKRTRRE